MDWNKFYEEKERIRKNLNEFTDDIIRSDGTLGPMPGSDAAFKYDQEEIIEYAQNLGLIPAPVDEPNKCPACGTNSTESSWGEAGYLQCNECGQVF